MMLSPKKGLLCNLNHIHLQHISLGLHLSRHPELQEGPVTMAPGGQTGCSDYQEDCDTPEQVDANSNNTSMQCRCCKSHPQQSPMLGLHHLPLPKDFPSVHIEEELASPSDLASSSVSTCSDFSLEDTPVSVYCKAFPSEKASSPGSQPSLVPPEDAASLTGKGEPSDSRHANLNVQGQERLEPGAWESPDSLCSSTLLDSPSDGADSPSGNGQGTVAELLPTGVCAELDSNCNSLPALSTEPSALSALPPGQQGSTLHSSVQAPPPVPPRAKWGLSAQHRSQVHMPVGDQSMETAQKTITSFHELAQKRKKNLSEPPPHQAKKDPSDWLIVFSPDKELPPQNELTCCSPLCLEPPGPLLQPDEPAKPPPCSHGEVTTFKELRYRSAISKHRGQLAWEQGERAAAQAQPESQQAAVGTDVFSSSQLQGPDWVPPLQLDGHLLALRESHLARRQSPGLQPITEGLLGDTGEGGQPLEGYVLRRKNPEAGCEKEALGWRLRGPAGDPWVSEKARKGDRTCNEVRQSQSFAGVAGTGQHWMANADRAREHRIEQKKALLVALSASVEKIIAYFSTARSVVQKTQLGDSWLSPDVSYLLLSSLCPALHALVADGLKPFQKDIITGQRKSSPWRVVEASVKPGPSTQPLHSLYWEVSRLAPLRSSRQRFHAFVLGLLNMKQLEPWLAHLHNSPGVISLLYLPTAFLSLSQGLFPNLARELLLLVQPLSALTFHLDLLFEHHHLPHRLASPPSHPPCPALAAAPQQGWDATQPAGWAEGPGGTSPKHDPSDLEPGRATQGGSEDSTGAQDSAAATKMPPYLPGGSLKQKVQQVLQFGGKLTQTLLGAECPPQPVPQDGGQRRGGWWGLLSQASEIYTMATKERFPCTHWPKQGMAAGDASSGQAALPRGSSQASVKEPLAWGGQGAGKTELQLLKPAIGGRGASVLGLTPCRKAGSLDAPKAEELPPQADAKGCAGPTEMEPSEPSASKSCLPASEELIPAGRPPGWLGRLFGDPCLPARGLPTDPDTSAAKSRRPSSWLPPRVNILTLLRKRRPLEKMWLQEQQEMEVSDSPQLHRAVRALCDHTGAGDQHLSFRKGDVLQILATVDEDWIHCCLGNNTGLVPVGYTSLIC
ncbi:AP-4 complex accessory subunit RUSC1 isoform X2 [Carettochelys insculpta]|uniref:AP-4 complex accessory subunit RUSC1 isoform X2 n=1 Tax=Carettochelys insculpta TaxID=44489 RepID=UPI003EBFB748